MALLGCPSTAYYLKATACLDQIQKREEEKFRLNQRFLAEGLDPVRSRRADESPPHSVTVAIAAYVPAD